MKLIKEQQSSEQTLKSGSNQKRTLKQEDVTLYTGGGVIWRLGEAQCGERVGSLVRIVAGGPRQPFGSCETRTISAATGCTPQRSPHTGPSGDMYVSLFIFMVGGSISVPLSCGVACEVSSPATRLRT